MVVSDLHILGAALAPYKTDTPLVVDPDRVLSFTVTAQLFEVICWWNAKVFQDNGCLNHRDFAKRYVEHTSGKPFPGATAQDLLDQLSLGALYHTLYVS